MLSAQKSPLSWWQPWISRKHISSMKNLQISPQKIKEISIVARIFRFIYGISYKSLSKHESDINIFTFEIGYSASYRFTAWNTRRDLETRIEVMNPLSISWFSWMTFPVLEIARHWRWEIWRHRSWPWQLVHWPFSVPPWYYNRLGNHLHLLARSLKCPKWKWVHLKPESNMH